MALGRVEATPVMGTAMSNPFCHLVNVELPIVQAAMGGASCPELCAAVGNAGGLGMLALSWSSADETRREIRRARELTAHPFGVNLVLDWPQEERLAICLEEGVPIISFFWGQTGRLIEVAHQGGAKVLYTVSSATEVPLTAATLAQGPQTFPPLACKFRL
jgi:nitronate monooxygenase